MYDMEQGGRPCGFTRGYAPHFVVEGHAEWLAVRALSPICTSPVGVPFPADFSLMYSPSVDYSALAENSSFAIHEGPKIVGTGTVIRRLPDYSDPVLYCPRCGDRFARGSRGELFCARGQIGLSEDLEEQFTARYIEKTRPSTRSTFTYGDRPQAVGGNWFCPGCSSPIAESSPGVLTCSNCSQSIADFVYHIIEHRPHA